jgi:DNA-binding response OmpR family regulator
MRILLIEDEKMLADNLKLGLIEESFAVDVFYNGRQGYEQAATEEYDAIILDLMLPEMDGVAITKQLRKEKIHTPILMLTARDTTENKIEGLNSGADDYVVKPFSFEELLARIRSLIRRSTIKEPILKVDTLELNTNSHIVTRHGEKINVTAKEYALLEYFMHHPNQILTREQINNHVWDYSQDLTSNIIDVLVKRLRNKIDKAFPKEKTIVFYHSGDGIQYKTMTHVSQFNKARLTLTALYCAILLLILVAFSFALYTTQNQDYLRIVVRRDFGNNVPKTLTINERRLIREQLRELRQSFVVHILLIDAGVLLFGGALGFFLAGKTLKPIQNAMLNQKNFLADASHELRTPLAAIQTATEVSLRSKTRPAAEYKNTLSQINTEVQRLKTMVEDLLMISRFETGEVKIHRKPNDISHITTQAIEEMKPLMVNHKLSFKQSILNNIQEIVDADSYKQLVLILLDNAIKYTPSGGKIYISLTKSPVMLTVSDSGIGIKKDKLPFIFDRFFQADPSRNSKGAGLGLSIAKKIALLHNATISVKSQEGKGSTFSVVFS